ncbi:protein SYS1 homolog [Plutella xylostella]|uniref:protein SYS1 homolog n=1 Tax=Plutella xylostella TaxID=51655 RepID=UPI002032F6C2|nr:protein SYS1 homolog [Plutella xylostella]
MQLFHHKLINLRITWLFSDPKPSPRPPKSSSTKKSINFPTPIHANSPHFASVYFVRSQLPMSKMKKLTGSFRYTQWDPCLITCQIVSMQSVCYLSLCVLVAIMEDLTSSTRTLDHIFEYHEIHVRDGEGRSVISAFVLNAIIAAVALWFIVGRTKLCLDFSCTYYGIHLIACWMYNGSFPTTFSWWTLNVACAAITCVSGEFLCLRTELQAIPLSNIGAKVDL